jgi:hypothetical protein
MNGYYFDAEREVQRMFDRIAAEHWHEERHRAALHEAGHAYALWRLKYPFVEIAIDREGGGTTATSAAAPAWTVRSAALVLHAGSGAERAVYGDATDASDGDEERLDAILAGRPELGPQLRADTDRLIREGRSAITAVADVLARTGHLRGEDAVAIFAEHSPADIHEARGYALTADMRADTIRSFVGRIASGRAGFGSGFFHNGEDISNEVVAAATRAGLDRGGYRAIQREYPFGQAGRAA